MIALTTLGFSSAWAYEKEDQGETIILPTSTFTVISIEDEHTGYTPVEVSPDKSSVDENGYEKEKS